MSRAILATAPYPKGHAEALRPHRSAHHAAPRPGGGRRVRRDRVARLARDRLAAPTCTQIEIDGTPVNYVDIGEGELEPIVFVHGLGGQWQNFLENIPRAAQERRVIALDLPGFGCTPEPRGKITIPGYGRCVDALCEKLSLGRVDIVGNSMGGYRRGRGGDPVPGADRPADPRSRPRGSRARTSRAGRS